MGIETWSENSSILNQRGNGGGWGAGGKNDMSRGMRVGIVWSGTIPAVGP